jgi:hypothetical protein
MAEQKTELLKVQQLEREIISEINEAVKDKSSSKSLYQRGLVSQVKRFEHFNKQMRDKKKQENIQAKNVQQSS